MQWGAQEGTTWNGQIQVLAAPLRGNRGQGWGRGHEGNFSTERVRGTVRGCKGVTVGWGPRVGLLQWGLRGQWQLTARVLVQTQQDKGGEQGKSEFLRLPQGHYRGP